MAISLESVSLTTEFIYDLRLVYQLFEEAQRSRVAHGERLRAIFQGRTVAGGAGRTENADALLKTIARGNTLGAPTVLPRRGCSSAPTRERRAMKRMRRTRCAR